MTEVRPPKRLSPLTPVVRGGVLVAAAAFASFDSLFSGEVGPFGIILLAIVDNQPQVLTLAQMLRFFLALALVPSGISIVWALFDEDRQFLHDRLAGTRLVSHK